MRIFYTLLLRTIILGSLMFIMSSIIVLLVCAIVDVWTTTPVDYFSFVIIGAGGLTALETFIVFILLCRIEFRKKYYIGGRQL